MSDRGDSEEPEKPDPEAVRLWFDKVAIEDSRYRTYLDRIRVTEVPLQEKTRQSREFATVYAQSCIKSLFLLNGGALIGFPAFAEVADVPLDQHLAAFLISGGSFVAGLVLIGVTSLLAYLSVDAQVAQFERAEWVARVKLNDSFNPENVTAEEREKKDTWEREEKKFRKISHKLTVWAVGVGTLSLVAFIVGAMFAAAVLAGW